MHRFGGFSAPPPTFPSGDSDEEEINPEEVSDHSQGNHPAIADVDAASEKVMESKLLRDGAEDSSPIELTTPRRPRAVTFLETSPKPRVSFPDESPIQIDGLGDLPALPLAQRPLVRQISLNHSLKMCMDPICTSCPPELHALRRRRPSPRPTAASPVASRSLKDELEDLSGSDDDDEHSSTAFIIWKRLRKCLSPKYIMRFFIDSWTTARGLFSFREAMNPNSPFVKNWNRFFFGSMIIAFAVDPLFFFVTALDDEAFCLKTQWTYVYILVILRTITDFVYFLHLLMQFRLAFREPAIPMNRIEWWKSKDSAPKVPGELNFDLNQIVEHYLRGWFVFDFLGFLPMPQIIALGIIPTLETGSATVGANLLRLCILLQYIPRARRCYVLIGGSNSTGFLFESAWASFVINLIMYLMASHVVGATWYLAATQRWDQCIHNSCSSNASGICQQSYINCPHGFNDSRIPAEQLAWAQSVDVGSCIDPDNSSLDYGLFSLAVPLMSGDGFFNKYIFALAWGFQQISTLAGNLVPSYFIPEVLFLIFVTGSGLLLFAVLIGNIQNFLQALSRRTFEYQLHRRDVEQWMQRRNLPRPLAKKVRELERLQWAANHGVNEDEVLGSLTEDLQREVRRHLSLELIKKSKLFSSMDEAVHDFICERLVQRIYINGTVIMRETFPVSRMFFVLKGQLESVATAGGRTGFYNKATLVNGDFFGEELLIAYLEGSEEAISTRRRKKVATRKDFSRKLSRGDGFGSSSFKDSGAKLLDVLPGSERTITCIGAVEGFTLEASDLEFMCRQFRESLHSDRVQTALNQCSKSRQTKAAVTIQLLYRAHLRRVLHIGLAHFHLAQRERRIGGLIRNALTRPSTKSKVVLLKPVYPSRAPSTGGDGPLGRISER